MNTQAQNTLKQLQAVAAKNVVVKITEVTHPTKGLCYDYTFTGIEGLSQPFTSGLYPNPTFEQIQEDVKRACFISGSVLNTI